MAAYANSKPVVVRLGQTAIRIHPRGSGAFFFRYCLLGQWKQIERTTLTKAKDAALRIAKQLESGCAQTGTMTAADVSGYLHAVTQLEKLGDDAPPLHVALAEYVAAKSLAGGVPLLDIVRGYMQAHPAAGGAAAPVAATIERFLARVGDRAKNPRYLRGLRCDLGEWAKSLPPGKGLNLVEPEGIAAYLRALEVGPRRRDNIRNELVSLFRFAQASRMLPADRKTAPELVERLGSTPEITFYRPDQLRAIFAHARPEWIPWLALGAFAGIRSAEIVGDPEDPKRPRLTWGSFLWDKGQIIVPASAARKIKRARRVPMRPNLMAWLLPWRNASGHLYPEGADQFQEIERIERRAKIDWDNNALRHSYATHRNAEIGNAGQLAEEMGTSIAMIRKHYDAVPAHIDPPEYFGIMPGESAKVIPLPLAFPL